MNEATQSLIDNLRSQLRETRDALTEARRGESYYKDLAAQRARSIDRAIEILRRETRDYWKAYNVSLDTHKDDDNRMVAQARARWAATDRLRQEIQSLF